MPRLRRFVEAVDDHQVHFAQRLEAAVLVTVVDDIGRLADAVASAAAMRPHGLGHPDLAGALRLALDAARG